MVVYPVGAKTLTTDSKGLLAGAVKILVKDGAIPAHYAQPLLDVSFLIIMVIQKILGCMST
jgi:carboxymethylenebutenolidase